MRTVLALAAVLALAGCGGATTTGSGSTHVVAAFFPLAWAASQVGGAAVRVTDLTPPGAEPHDVELGPREVAAIQRADVVLYLSHRFQPAVEAAARDARGKRIDALAGLRLRGVDPHVWLDPVLFARVVDRVGAALGRPRRAHAVAQRLHALDGEYRRGLARCDSRTFVTTHAAFGYLARRYRLHEVAITGTDPEAEPGARDLGRLAQRIRDGHIRVVFFERLASASLAQTLAREAGARTLQLDPLESEPSGTSYLGAMRANLRSLQEALGCR